LGQVLDSQVRPVAVIHHDRVQVGAAEQAMDKDVRFARQVESGVSSSHEGLDEDDPVNRAADQLVDRPAFNIRVPVGVDDHAEVAALLEEVLYATDDGGGERAHYIVDNDADSVGALGAKAPCHEVGVVAKLLSKGEDVAARLFIHYMVARTEGAGHGGNGNPGGLC
jgi:hypothetical protein